MGHRITGWLRKSSSRVGLGKVKIAWAKDNIFSKQITKVICLLLRCNYDDEVKAYDRLYGRVRKAIVKE